MSDTTPTASTPRAPMRHDTPGQQVAQRPAASNCRLINWAPWPHPNPSLHGHRDVVFGGGIVVHQIPVFRRADGSLSVGVPNAAQVDAEGRIKVRDGKRQYVSALTFESAEARARWQRMVTGALAEDGIEGVAP